MQIPRIFQVAALVFFIMGLLLVPVSGHSAAHAAYYKVVLYVLAALVFWIWLHHDAPKRGVSRPWQLLVAAGWLIAAVPVVPAYFVVTRGWRQGAIATLAMFAIVLVTFAVFGVGTLLSTILANMLGFAPR